MKGWFLTVVPRRYGGETPEFVIKQVDESREIITKLTFRAKVIFVI